MRLFRQNYSREEETTSLLPQQQQQQGEQKVPPRTAPTWSSSMSSSWSDDKDSNNDDDENPLDTTYNSSPRNGYTWERLVAIEEERHRILGQVELPFLRVLLASWKGTSLVAVLQDCMVWISMALFLIIRVLVHLHAANEEWLRLPTSLTEAFGGIDILGGFLSFILVLFVNQTNARFFDMYSLSRAVSGRVQDVTQIVVARLPLPAAARLVRYLNAAHVTGYVGLGHRGGGSSPYTRQSLFDPLNTQHQMLLPHELERLTQQDGLDMDAGGSDVFKELCVWANKEIASAQSNGFIDSYEATSLQLKICDFRAAMDGIHDTCFQPPHFFYIHFLCLLSGLYLPLFALETAGAVGWDAEDGLAISKEILSALLVLLQSIFVIGLRMLGQKMINPYGADYEDLSVVTFVKVTLHITGIMLSASDQETVDASVEHDILLRHVRQAKPHSKRL